MADDRLGIDLVRECVIGEYETVAKHGRQDVNHVLRNHVIAAADERDCTSCADSAEGGTRRSSIGQPP